MNMELPAVVTVNAFSLLSSLLICHIKVLTSFFCVFSNALPTHMYKIYF